MASLDRVGRILPGLFPLLLLASCTATAVSAPAAGGSPVPICVDPEAGSEFMGGLPVTGLF